MIQLYEWCYSTIKKPLMNVLIRQSISGTQGCFVGICIYKAVRASLVSWEFYTKRQLAAFSASTQYQESTRSNWWERRKQLVRSGRIWEIADRTARAIFNCVSSLPLKAWPVRAAGSKEHIQEMIITQSLYEIAGYFDLYVLPPHAHTAKDVQVSQRVEVKNRDKWLVNEEIGKDQIIEFDKHAMYTWVIASGMRFTAYKDCKRRWVNWLRSK